MKPLKNIIQEGILSDVDTAIEINDSTVKKIAAFNKKTLDFTEFVQSFADYFKCPMPKIKKGKGKLSMVGVRFSRTVGNEFIYGEYGGGDNVADMHITHSVNDTTKMLYSIRFVDDKYSKGFYVQIKSTVVHKISRNVLCSMYRYYDGDITIKDFIKNLFLNHTSYFNDLFDKSDF